ncbi:MAG TPA: hypothetical protein VLT62_10825 [Candidatus Methylomirabilis sp.]|nr:hypothetical protein [Candidatus Methylomirabilis sp.]
MFMGWVVGGCLCVPAQALDVEDPAKASPAEVDPAGTVDRAVVEEALSPAMPELRAQSEGELRAYVKRLAHLHSSLEREPGLSASEAAALRERLLARVTQVGLLLRERAGAPAVSGRRREALAVDLDRVSAPGPIGMLVGPSGVLLGLLGGLVIAFALGNLAGYRRGTRHASYYGYAEGDPRLRFLARPPAEPARLGETGRITLPMIHRALADGRTVLLQLGYDVAPAHRPRYLELLGQMQEALDGAPGLTHSAWEDPRHPHRFYELLVCGRSAALEAVSADGRLAKLGEAIESCRLPGGLILRRIWWSVPAGTPGTSRLTPMPEDAWIPGGVD